MVDNQTTVDLPADPRIKQLAHDVKRDEAEWAVPLIYDFYQFLAAFDEEDHVAKEELRQAVDGHSEFSEHEWQTHLDLLEQLGYIEKHLGGTTTYTLSDDLSDSNDAFLITR